MLTSAVQQPVTCTTPTAARELLGYVYTSRLSAAGTLRNHRQRLEQALARVRGAGSIRAAMQAELERLEVVIGLLVEPRERVVSQANRHQQAEADQLQVELSILPNLTGCDLHRQLDLIRNQRIAGTSTAGLFDHD